jgi:serine/threonine protein kinase
VLRIGHYEIVEEIGKGAAAVVYRARNPRGQGTLALKWFPRQGGAAGQAASEREKQAIREARIAASLRHPNIVAVHRVEWYPGPEGGLLLAMEEVPGVTVEEWMRSSGPPPVPAALSIVRHTARGLAHAHCRGIVHRDVKPANLILTPDGSVKIADFGIAREEDASGSHGRTFEGTPVYLAPEQVLGGPVDARADLFALGATLYFLLTGRRPFAAPSVAETLSRIVHHDPCPPSALRPGLGSCLDEVVEALLSKEPAGRPSSAAEVERALDEAEATWRGSQLRQQPVRGWHDWLLPAGVALVTLLGGVLAWVLLR